MSRSCDICCKGVRPNLVSVKTVIDGRSITLTVCTRCLRSDFLVKKVRVPKPVAEVAK